LANKGFLLDTTVLIDFLRGRREIVCLLEKLVEEAPLACCPVTVTEVFSGVRPEELTRVEELLDALHYCAIQYSTARRAGFYRRDYQKKGITLTNRCRGGRKLPYPCYKKRTAFSDAGAVCYRTLSEAIGSR